MSIAAKLIYGIRYKYLPEEIKGTVQYMVDNGELDYASPYYDSEIDSWIVGVEIPCRGKDQYVLGCEVNHVDDTIPDILRRDDIELWMYVTPHVS